MKLSISSGRMQDIRNGQETGPVFTQTAMLMDDGRIFAHVGPPYAKDQKLTHAGPELPGVVDVAISTVGLFALTGAGHIYQYNIGATSEQGRWTKDKDAKDVVSMAGDSAGSIWCINKKGEIYRAGSMGESGGLSAWARVDAVNAAGVL